MTRPRLGGVLAAIVVLALAVALASAAVGPGATDDPPTVAAAGPDTTATGDAPADDPAAGADDALPGDVSEPEVTASREVTQQTLWLCGPAAADDACTGALDATVVAADGTRSVEPFVPDHDPPIDCFYVYPTVSQAGSRNAPLEVTDANARWRAPKLPASVRYAG